MAFARLATADPFTQTSAHHLLTRSISARPRYAAPRPRGISARHGTPLRGHGPFPRGHGTPLRGHGPFPRGHDTPLRGHGPFPRGSIASRQCLSVHSHSDPAHGAPGGSAFMCAPTSIAGDRMHKRQEQVAGSLNRAKAYFVQGGARRGGEHRRRGGPRRRPRRVTVEAGPLPRSRCPRRPKCRARWQRWPGCRCRHR